MALATRKFATLTEVNTHLAGRLVGGVDLTHTQGSLYLHGKTLVFNTPAATITFVATPASGQVALTLKEVKDQILAQSTSTITATYNRGRLEVRATTPGVINLDLTGTANALLGFSQSEDSVGTPVNAPGGANPVFIALVPDTASNGYVLVVGE